MPKEPRISHARHRSSPLPQRNRSATTPLHSTSPTPSHKQKASSWTTEDDEILSLARSSGLNWKPIATQYFPRKTANACRKRHERLVERRSVHGEEWEAKRLEALAEGYMACRRDMWSVLARFTGERWAAVEAKCFEKGMRNLQAIARAADRKATGQAAVLERSDRTHDANEDDDDEDEEGDSGLGLSDIETGLSRPASAIPKDIVPRHLRQHSAPEPRVESNHVARKGTHNSTSRPEHTSPARLPTSSSVAPSRQIPASASQHLSQAQRKVPLAIPLYQPPLAAVLAAKSLARLDRHLRQPASREILLEGQSRHDVGRRDSFGHGMSIGCELADQKYQQRQQPSSRPSIQSMLSPCELPQAT